MKEKYKKHIEIDEEHMKNTIELTKLIISKREVKYETSKMNVWLNFFRMESMKFCIMSILSTLVLCLLSFSMSSYGICLMNAGITGTILLYDFLASSMSGMDELLKSVKYNSSKIFIYKSNIYLFISIITTLFLNVVLCMNHNFSFITCLLFSLIPLYFISGAALLIVDRIANKAMLIVIYACTYLICWQLSLHYEWASVDHQLILLLLLLSFGFYCLGIYVHALRISAEKGNDLWNSLLKD